MQKELLAASQRRLGATVRRLRLERGWKQPELAKQIQKRTGYDYDWKHVSQVERGKVNITLELLTFIAAGLSVDIARLFGPAPDHKPVPPAEYHLTDSDLEQLERWIESVRRNRRDEDEDPSKN